MRNQCIIIMVALLATATAIELSLPLGGVTCTAIMSSFDVHLLQLSQLKSIYTSLLSLEGYKTRTSK
jgi:hypothetical protein